MTDADKKLVHKYWKYKVRDHIGQAEGEGAPADYVFFMPFPERLAGITYVGHAARLRLALERARQGKRLRVGALGGSITAGQGVGTAENTYIRIFMDWLNAALPPRQEPRRLTQNEPTHIAAGSQDREPVGEGGDESLRGAGGSVSGAAVRAAAAGRGGEGVGGELWSLAQTRGTGAGWARGGREGGGHGGGSVRFALRHRRALRFGGDEENVEAEVQEEKGREDPAASSDGTSHAFINGAVPGTESAYTSSCLHHHLIPDPDLVFVDYAVNDLPTSTWTQGGPTRRAFERLIRKLLNLPSRPAVVLVNMYAMGPSHGKYWYTAERDFSEFGTYYGLPSVSLKAAVLPSLYVAAPKQLSHNAIFNGGLNHPGRGAHVMVAEILITMCLELVRTTPLGTTAAAMESVVARPLPPPLAPGNLEAMSKTCYIKEELQSLVQPPHEGWEWTDEGRNKWGYVAMELEKTIRIRVNTRLVDNRTDEDAGAPIIVQIAHLQSYRGMGTAQVACVEGCECKPETIDAYDPREVSLTWMADVKVTQHPNCVLELTSGPPSRAARKAAGNSALDSGENSGHKFKLMGVVVGEEPGAKVGTVMYLRQESHELWRSAPRDAGRLT